ncbi:MAG: aldo/keto reductase [Chloroflexi bacterium]|nr:aldo/keto reductase [Chloroflexota bacterium]
MMEKRPLGKTGLFVTPLGLGLAALGRPGYINLGHAEDLGANYDVEYMQRHAHEVLDAAWEAGIRYFDAARSYGRAEAFLGSWLTSRNIAPEEVTIGSKWGYTYTAGWQVKAEKHEVKDHSLSVLQRQYQESQELLKPYLSLYQIHSATLDSGVLENREVLEELARYREQGLVIGLSLSGPAQGQTLEKAMEVRMDGVPLFGCVQVTWNLLEPSTGPVLEQASREGWGIIVKEALANGRLTEKNTDPEFAPRLAVLKNTASELNTTVDALALAAVLAQPWASVVLSGAATREQLLSNCQALRIPWSAETASLIDALAETPQEYWSKRSALEWN